MCWLPDWPIPLALFAAAGLGMLREGHGGGLQPWVGVVLSQMVIVLWWSDAATDRLLDGLVGMEVSG
ncbi:MAG TPA: hypothetical protein VLB67_08200 [Acidimicrobiia bacterium]|nr:hypothetical protein [Acidimicrobiia bacterium]